MELRLTQDEKDLLVDILQERHKNLIHEIARTDHHDYKHQLRQRCSMLENILQKAQAEQPTAA